MSTLIRTRHDIGKLKTGEAALYTNQGRAARITFRLYDNRLYVDMPEVYRLCITQTMIQYLWSELVKTFREYKIITV